MAFPVSPTNGQTAVVNNITYQFSNVGNTWTRLVSTANVITANVISANTLNINNSWTAPSVSVTGNITGNYILGNGALLTGVSTTSSNINNGTSNVTVVSSGGNITVGVGGTGNVAVFATTGEYITGVVSATGNITGGNILTAGAISATGTLSVTGNTALSGVSTGNISAGNVITGGVVSATANITGGNLLTAGVVSATANITGGNVLTGGLISATSTITSAANITGGNLLTGGQVSATGNITGNYFIGNGSALTGIVSGGTITFSNTAPGGARAGDVWIQANTAIQYVYFDDGTSNQWAEMEAAQSFSTGGGAGTPGGLNTQIQFNDAGSFGASANLTFNTTSNTLSTVAVSATGNITGSYFIGNGSQLTSVLMSWSIANSNVTMSANKGYFVDTSGGAKTMTLPASAVIGDTIRINDLAGTFGTNNLTVARNSSNIQGVAQDLVANVNQSSFGLVYSNSTYGWKLLEL